MVKLNDKALEGSTQGKVIGKDLEGSIQGKLSGKDLQGSICGKLSTKDLQGSIQRKLSGKNVQGSIRELKVPSHGLKVAAGGLATEFIPKIICSSVYLIRGSMGKPGGEM